MSATIGAPPAPAAPPPAFIDPNHEVPDSVKAASSRADEMIRRLSQGLDPVTGEPPAPAPQPPANPAIPAIPPAQPEQPAQPPQPPQPPVEPPQPPQPPVEPPQPPAEPPQPPDALASLQAEVADLRIKLSKAEHEASTWRGRFDASQARVRTLEDAAKAAPAAPPAPPPPTVKPLSKEEMDEWGQPLLDAAARHAMSMVEPLVNARVAEVLATVNKEVGAVKVVAESGASSAHQMAVDRCYGLMDKEVPNWRLIEQEPEFIAWIGEYDPLLGGFRKDILDSAGKSLDGPRVVAFLRAYLAQKAGAASQGSPSVPSAGGQAPGTPAASPPAVEPPLKLEDLAAPGPTRGTNPAAPGGKKTWTRSEITEHARRVGRLEYRGRESEREAIDAEIAAAQREGRVDFSR